MKGEREPSKVKVRAVTLFESLASRLSLEYVQSECSGRHRLLVVERSERKGRPHGLELGFRRAFLHHSLPPVTLLVCNGPSILPTRLDISHDGHMPLSQVRGIAN